MTSFPKRSVFIGGILGCCLAVTTLAPLAFGFGGEDVKDGRPWHHLDMTLRALAGDAAADAEVEQVVVQGDGAGFTRDAAMSVAWHADYIDSYLYNPVFWLEGGLSTRRFKASLTMFEDLTKLHHDDTFTKDGILDNWTRYTSGTLIGLYWAAENQDVAAAHHLLGIATHAAQDFYSHTNWIDDPVRRSVTWFERSPAERQSLHLYSGAYEHSDSQAPHHHGAYSFSCTAINGTRSNAALSEVCGGISPLQNTGICVKYRACTQGAPVTFSLGGLSSSSFLYLNPKGIAVDTTWLTPIGGQERGLLNAAGEYTSGSATQRMSVERCDAVVNFGVKCDHDAENEICTRGGTERSCSSDSDYLFADTKLLALRTTTQYLSFIDRAMRDMDPTRSDDDYEKFWQRVKTEKSNVNDRTRQFEFFNQIPFQFLSSGGYPVKNPHSTGHPFVWSSNGWYLRLRIKTASARNSGTDADIRLRVDGPGYAREQILDYLPTNDPTGHTDNRFLVYNDFERGDNDVYTVGPFPNRPTRITLINDSADTGDVVDAAWEDFKQRVDQSLTDLRRGFLSIIGGNADFVGSEKVSQSFRQLSSDINAASGRHRTLMDMDRGDEGHFQLFYEKRFVSRGLTRQQRNEGWKAVEYKFTTLKCVEEAEWDRGSNSDEPFLFVSVAALNGLSSTRLQSFRIGPFSDVDKGETRSLNNQTITVRIPPFGGTVIAWQHFESDDENNFDRTQLFETFKTGLDEDTRNGNARLLDTIGRAVAEDWNIAEIEIFPFKRGSLPEVGPIQVVDTVGWINGGESKFVDLSRDAARQLVSDPTKAINKWYLPPSVSSFITPPLQAPIRTGTPTPRELARVLGSPVFVKPVWQGTWTSSFGELRLLQDGARVYGDYADRGSIDGQYNANKSKLKGSFTNGPRRGVFEWKLSGAAFSGRWKWADETRWRESRWDGQLKSQEKPKIDSE